MYTLYSIPMRGTSSATIKKLGLIRGSANKCFQSRLLFRTIEYGRRAGDQCPIAACWQVGHMLLMFGALTRK